MSLLKPFPGKINLYNEGASSALQLKEVGTYLKEKFPQAEVRESGSLAKNYLTSLSEAEQVEARGRLSRELAGIKIRQANKRDAFTTPLPGEIAYEEKYLGSSLSRPAGILYEGFSLVDIFSRLLPEKERGRNTLNIVFTNQLFSTWDEGDLRFHIRSSLYGALNFISTSGIVEAPAKPRDFYLLRQQYELLGRKETGNIELKEKFKGRFLDYDDQRLTGVVKGFCLQALFFHFAQEPFCQDKKCRLYNSHWQEDLIASQLAENAGLCPKHLVQLKQLAG